MAVRIRLKRIGKIHYPVYRIVVVDSRKKRDGRVIEEVGQYNPNEEPSFIQVKSDRVQYWLGVGAQPSDAVRRLLVLSGDIARFNGKENVESWIKTKETLSSEEAREKNVKAAADEAQKRKAKVSEEKAKAEAEAAKEAEEAAESAEAEEAAPESEEA
ncbi:30S ribosomal protein S16 [Varibaculum vaginae]|uniref:30S ribosomal protein S16 n=1 Tax=Varibaculum vaginae TaxID=2364797 RepID=UPI000F08B8AA|nr:30S ribosomal protein S16 [Varibaculum vaginae]